MTARRSRYAKRTIAATIALTAATYCGVRVAFYKLPPARAEVVDAATGKPIGGAVVSARWFAANANCIDGECLVREIAVAEGRTDESGRATVRGPLVRRSGFTVVSWSSPDVAVASAGRLMVSGPSAMAGKAIIHLSPVADIPYDIELFAGAVEWARSGQHEFLGMRLSRQPLLEREILKTYEQLPEDLRRRVNAEIERRRSRSDSSSAAP
jgi:hypothetical protein